MIILTNNPDVAAAMQETRLVFVEGGYRDVLCKARDMVHRGQRLLTHPLMGSLKPNETPYRSIAVSEEAGDLDYDSLQLIEDAIATFDKFAQVVRHDRGEHAPERMLADFRLIDASLIQAALQSAAQAPDFRR